MAVVDVMAHCGAREPLGWVPPRIEEIVPAPGRSLWALAVLA